MPVRRGEGEDLSGPPSVARLDELARRARAAGLKWSSASWATPVQLPPGIDLTAYRIVQEALTNALKHAGSARASVTVAYEPGEVVLTIEDDGEGPREDYELSEAGGGHGLVGMRERAALYGGLVQAGRRRGGGFAVRARLPTRPLVPGAELSGAQRAGARMSVRVLLVDDQALIRAGFRMILDAEEDIEVVGECADGTQAVDSVRRLKPDVVLMDIRMPEMDGIEATRLIADGGGEAAPPRVLMLTTFDLDEYVYDALRAGASGFLLKDVPAEQLVEGIRLIAQGEALLAPIGHEAADPGVLAHRGDPALGAGRARRPDPARARGLQADRARHVQRRDRRRAGGLGDDREDARGARADEARRARPGAGGGARLRVRRGRAGLHAERVVEPAVVAGGARRGRTRPARACCRAPSASRATVAPRARQRSAHSAISASA